MSSKKPKKPKQRPKVPPSKRANSRAGSRPEEAVGIPDQRLIERGMRKFLAEQFGGAEETPLDRAQELVYDALEEPDPSKRARLIQEALVVSPDVADAYVVLAEDAPTRKAALRLYEEGVAAGERALGPSAFQEHVGRFWGVLETRGYMRAREGLAITLWTMGRQEEAVAHLQDMLRLNPGDNQGVRYNLATWLMSLDRFDELGRLLDAYDEDSANWNFTSALLAFRREGDTEGARALLQAAHDANSHVAEYLLEDLPLPREGPSSYSLGGRDEAILYVLQGLSPWRSVPGALAWAREVLRGKPDRKKAEASRPATGPSADGIARLKKLPREAEVWEVDFRRMPSLVETDGELVQPWLILVASLNHKSLEVLETEMQQPTAARMWDVLAGVMTRPRKGPPRRPSELRVIGATIWDELHSYLEELDVECFEEDELPAIDFLFDDMSNHLRGEEPPGLLDSAGMTRELVAGFYQAGAEFYRRAPWRSLGFEEAIRIESDRFRGGPWYAVIMGQSGLVQGLTLYTDLKLLRRIWDRSLSEQQTVQLSVALTVQFGPQTELSTAEILAGREEGWEVAGPDAYPWVFKKEKGMNIRPPVPWELELMEACLRAIPPFMAVHRPGDTTPDRRTVRAGAGEATLVLSWLDEY